jgi:H+/gluconate symporter-like permease
VTAASVIVVVAFFMLLPPHPKPTLWASGAAYFFRGVLLLAHALYHRLRVQLPKAV